MTRTAIGKRVEALEVQARAAKWAVYLAWLDGLPGFEAPDYNTENAVEIDAALCSRFPELVITRTRKEQERLAQYEARIAAEDGMTQDQAMKQFDPPQPLTRADTLEGQHYAALTAGILSSKNLTADERAFLLARKAELEWLGNLVLPQIETAETVC